jgi:hypothetical protein
MDYAAWWHFTDHVCARCLGRVFSRRTDEGETVVRCAILRVRRRRRGSRYLRVRDQAREVR